MFRIKDYKDRVDFSNIKLSFKEAILAKCYDCCCYDRKEVKACNIKHCSLYNFKQKWVNKIKDE